jgi:lysophospholipase L1-like esterase
MRSLLAAIASAALIAGCAGAPPPAPSVSASAALPTPVATTPQPSPSPSAAGLVYVAVGDSIPYGQDDCSCDGFPTLFGAWIQKTTGRHVDVRNLSQHDNNTAARMAVEMAARPDLLDALRLADVITVTIGHNDTPWNATDDACDADHGPLDQSPKATWQSETGPCLRTEVARYRKNLASILDQIVALRAGKPTALRFTEQYNDIPGDPCCRADAVAVSATIKDAFNAAACAVVATHRGVCIDVYHAFNGPKGTAAAGALLAADHTHPSAAGHQKIADLLAAAGLAPLS